jgi:endonuclease-8
MHDALAGRVLVRTDFRVPQHATADLTGRSVTEVVSRGKHLLIRFDGDTTLHTHFKMNGSWRLHPAGKPWKGGPAYEVRVVLANETWEAVGYRLPVVELLATTDEERAVGHLGPDLLGPPGTVGGWDEEEALRRLSGRPDREIGPALLDQRNLAGIGNLYKTEALFLSGLTPWAEVGSIDDLKAVVARARRLMDANKQHWSQTTTGSTHRGEEHWVFERGGRSCRRCGTRIRQAMQSEPQHPEHARVCYWCPYCQAGPAPD